MAAFGYPLARVHARHALRPGVAEWRRLELARSREECLLAARRTGLAAWLGGIPDRAGVDRVESQLREQARRYAHEVAGWLPAASRPAVRWLARLPDLEVIAYLQRGGPPLPWIVQDAAYAPWTGGPRDAAAAAWVPDPAPLLVDTDAGPARAWQCHWERLLESADAPGVARLGPALRRHVARSRSGSGAPLRRAFRGRVHGLAAIAAHVGLVTADLRRLAGLLASRLPTPLAEEGG